MDEYEREADRYLYHPSDDEFEGTSSDGPHSYSDDGYENIYTELEQKELQYERDEQADYYPETRTNTHEYKTETFRDKLPKYIFYATGSYIVLTVIWVMWKLLSHLLR